MFAHARASKDLRFQEYFCARVAHSKARKIILGISVRGKHENAFNISTNLNPIIFGAKLSKKKINKKFNNKKIEQTIK